MGAHKSQDHREAMLDRWLHSGLSLRSFAEQVDIPISTLHCWKERYLKKEVPVAKKTTSQAWSPEQKFAVVLETATLSETEINAYCREKGLYPDQVRVWRDACIQGNAEPNQNHSTPRSSKDDKKKIKQLERELTRKEKALAEAAALLILRKKYNALWEESGDD